MSLIVRKPYSAWKAIQEAGMQSFSSQLQTLVARDLVVRARTPLLAKAKIVIPVVFGSLLGFALFR